MVAVRGSGCLLTEIKDRFTVTYTDSNVQAGGQYYYKITAVDKFLQEGYSSSTVNVAATPDVTIPVVLGVSPVDGTVIGPNRNPVPDTNLFQLINHHDWRHNGE